MKKIVVPVALAVMLLFTAGCGFVGNLIGGGGSTATTLWADVPPMDGAAPDARLQLPPVARLAVQAVVQGNLEFIAYTTSKSPQEVADFYTVERMQAAGWNAGTGGCQVTNDNSGSGGGGLCTFNKTDGNREIVLAIVIARDQNAAQTQIYYVRAQGISTPEP
jgi:hypothetical protein